MAVHPHPTGGFRAYKRINGFEYQVYERELEKAQQAQTRLDALAKLSSSPAIAKCNRLLGCRLRLISRADRAPYIAMRIVRQNGLKRTYKDIRYKGQFEPFWKLVLEHWKSIYEISREDARDLFDEIKRAKSLYLSDLGKLEEQMKA